MSLPCRCDCGKFVARTFAGNVGIGTAAPGLPLDARGTYNAPAASGSTQNGVLRIGATSAYTHVLDVGAYSTSPYAMWLQANQSTNLAQTFPIVLQPNGGNVGIGTTSPRAALDVTVSSTDDPAGGGPLLAGIHIVNLDTTANAMSGIQFQANDSGGTGRHSGAIVMGKETDWLAAGGSFPGYLAFWTRVAGGEELERFRITSSGNVGIGTTAPGTTLHVNGTALVSSANTQITSLDLTNTSTTPQLWRMQTVGSAVTGRVGNFELLGNTNSSGSWTAGLVIQPSGNVGIGTTAPGAKLEVAGTAGTDGIKFPDATLQTSAAVLTRWTNTGASTIGATTTAPTKGTNSTDQVSWRRVGDTMEMRWRYVQSATGSAGSGYYLLTIPGGYAIDTTKLPVPNNAIDYRAGVGTIKFSYASGSGVCVGPVYAYNSTQLFAEVHCYNGGSGNGMWGSSYISFALVAQQAITLEASFPVSGW